jgi:hypothetical protein
MLNLLRQFFADIHRIAECIAANRMQETLVTLSQADRDLLANFHRRKPRVKKTTEI